VLLRDRSAHFEPVKFVIFGNKVPDTHGFVAEMVEIDLELASFDDGKFVLKLF